MNVTGPNEVKISVKFVSHNPDSVSGKQSSSVTLCHVTLSTGEIISRPSGGLNSCGRFLNGPFFEENC